MSDRKSTWMRILGVLLFFALLAAAWQWTPLKGLLDLERVADWVEPHRTAWYAPPVVVAAFVLLGILMVPVLLLITATGIAFGPWLGSIYALAGALTSASVGFAFGRLAGQRRIEKVGGRKIGDISRKIERNGTLAVYVIRKIPMPFLFSNLVIGASRVRFRDFLLGSVLGLGPIVIALAGFGYHLTRSLNEPTPAKIALAVSFLAVPLTIAWILNRVLRRSPEGVMSTTLRTAPGPLLQPGRTCWTVAPVFTSGLLIDGRDYFREFHRAAQAARRCILLAGWQFDTNVALLRGKDRANYKEDVQLLPFLRSLCRRNPDLRIYLLCWDYSPAYFFQREWLQDFKFNWSEPGIRFRFDDRHAVGASHHQKFAVIDGSLAFVGSTDFCNHRWDRRDHDLQCDERCHPAGIDVSGPYHEVQAYFTGPAATQLVELFEARWTLSGGTPLQLAPPQPVDVRIRPSARIGGGKVGLSRTMARTLEPPHPPVREIRRLHIDAILSADHSIFIENQYFGSRAIFDALCRRFARTDRPPLEVALIYPRELHSVTEQLSVGTQQAAMFRHLQKAAATGGHRLGIYTSLSCEPGVEPRARYIHSKVMIVDDRFMTVGSANTNNRSMGLDSELHVSWEAPGLFPAIRRARLNLLIEHAGVNPRLGVKLLGAPTGWVEVLDRWATAERGALRLHPISSSLDDNLLVQTLSVEGPIGDPERAVLEEEIFEEIAPSRRERVAAGIRRLRRVFGRKGRTEWIVAVNPPAALATRGPSGPWAFLARTARRWIVPFILLLLLFLAAWGLIELLDLFD